MASDDDSQGLDTHHDDREWEDQKENFRVCYLDNNRTRKDAADYMKRHHNFNATPRQWERKIKQWGFGKYTGRDERLTQIASAGKSVLDVSRPGRRPRSLVDEHGNLQPHEDRNLRRFARREVSRSRSRSRSASFTDRRRPHFKHEFSDPSADSTMGPSFTYNEIDSEMQKTPSRDGSPMTGMQAARERAVSLQHNYFQTQQAGAHRPIDHPKMASGVPAQWTQSQHHSSPPFQAAAPLSQFNAFSSGPMPLHASQGVGFQSSNQAFPGNSASASFGYHVRDPALQPIPAGYGQFPMPETSMGMHPGIMPEDIMTEQAMFDNTIQMPQTSDELGQDIFDSTPLITFDMVDMDSEAMMSAPGPAPLASQAVMPIPSSEALRDNGPLGTDVLPLMEQYTRTLQAMTLGALAGFPHADLVSSKLAADLVQPSECSNPLSLPC